MEKEDILSVEVIQSYLNNKNASKKILLFNELDSTNNEAKRRIVAGAPDKTVIIANSQTAGRGRMGRSFFSPADSGLYFSIILKPDIISSDAVLVTTAASVAVSRAIEKVSGKTPEIKWVNDLFLNGKKVCGILAEAVSKPETGEIMAIVVGIGINCTTTFPDELADIAGCILDEKKPIRCHLAAELINEFSELDKSIKNRKFLEYYRKHSMVLGKTVTVLNEPDSLYTAEEIGENGELILRSNDGNIRILNSGEISIRING